jgi:AAA+ ATPase superfamily predicted ATPase
MVYRFPSVTQFRNRQSELQELASWWERDISKRAINLYGRRRVGKSWLFRRFAHGKETDIFVADTRGEHNQLARFAEQMAPGLGFRPDLPDFGALFRLLYRQAHAKRRLVVFDEFPFLWQVSRALPSVLLRVMEEEASSSRLKVVLCGSLVSQMEELLAERNALHGRTRPLPVQPFEFAEAREFLAGFEPVQLIERFAIAGGMPYYLVEFAMHRPIERLIAERVLNRVGPLFDEPRAVLTQELSTPSNHFSILGALSGNPLNWADLVARSGIDDKSLGKYLSILIKLHLVEGRMTVTETREARKRQYRLSDNFTRFWFRFVFPHQAEIEAGLDGLQLYRNMVLPAFTDHVSPVFEEICRAWVRRHYGRSATRIGSWWGAAEHSLRKSGQRDSEEIDIVGLSGKTVALVAECRWRNHPMDVSVLKQLKDFKLPALAQIPGIKIDPDYETLLFSRAGFTQGLTKIAANDRRVRLIEMDELVKTF